MGVDTEPLCESGSVSLAPNSGSTGFVVEGGSVSLAAPTSSSGQAAPATSAGYHGSTAPPPIAAVAAAGVAQKVMQNAAASSAAQGAGRLLKRGASTITLHMQANPYSVTVMSFVGGIVLTIVSFLNVLNLLNIFNPLSWILQLYQLAAGLLIIVIDGPSDKLPAFLRDYMHQSAAFLLHSNTNRVLFYLFIACQQGSQPRWFNWIVGYYFAFVALGFAAVQVAPATSGVGAEGQVGQP